MPKLINMINSKKYLTVGSGENRIHLIYIDDLIEGIMLAVKIRRLWAVHILSGERPVTVNRLVEIISMVLKKRPHVFMCPRESRSSQAISWKF